MRKKWEYRRRIAFVWNEMRIMEEMGGQGWQLCACWGLWLYFGRPVDHDS